MSYLTKSGIFIDDNGHAHYPPRKDRRKGYTFVPDCNGGTYVRGTDLPREEIERVQEQARVYRDHR